MMENKSKYFEAKKFPKKSIEPHKYFTGSCKKTRRGTGWISRSLEYQMIIESWKR